MIIKTLPKQERPREKLLSKGASSLSDSELLAIFLRTGIKGKSAIDLACELLSQFGSLKALFHAQKDTIYKVSGLGPAKYTQLQAILEMNRRYLFEKTKEQRYCSNPKETKAFLLAQLGHRTQEIFACLFLGANNQVIDFKELFYGGIDQADIYPREVLKAALASNASAVIITHNHPSGDPRPSQEDIEVTIQLQASLKLVDLRLLDHILVGYNSVYSMAEMGDL